MALLFENLQCAPPNGWIDVNTECKRAFPNQFGALKTEHGRQAIVDYENDDVRETADGHSLGTRIDGPGESLFAISQGGVDPLLPGSFALRSPGADQHPVLLDADQVGQKISSIPMYVHFTRFGADQSIAGANEGQGMRKD